MSELETLEIGKLHQEGRRIVLIVVLLGRCSWLSICGISLRGYADGLVKFPCKAGKAASEEAETRNSTEY